MKSFLSYNSLLLVLIFSSLTEVQIKPFSFFSRYARFLVRFSYIVVILVFIVVLWCALLGFIPELGAKDTPDFSKAVKVSFICGSE